MLMPQITLANLLVLGDLPGRALRQQGTFSQNGNTGSKLKDEFHVVLDKQNGKIAWQLGQCLKQASAFGKRNSCRGLVKQQHFRPTRQCKRDLKQALVTIGHKPCLVVDMVDQANGTKQFGSFIYCFGVYGRSSQKGQPCALCLAYGQCHGIERCHFAEQGADLKGAHEPTPDSLKWRQLIDAFAMKK